MLKNGIRSEEEKYEVSDEERRANVLKLRKVQWEIAEKRNKLKLLEWKQVHDPRALLKALRTFEGDD